jgi:hypothetical protein
LGLRTDQHEISGGQPETEPTESNAFNCHWTIEI